MSDINAKASLHGGTVNATLTLGSANLTLTYARDDENAVNDMTELIEAAEEAFTTVLEALVNKAIEGEGSVREQRDVAASTAGERATPLLDALDDASAEMAARARIDALVCCTCPADEFLSPSDCALHPDPTSPPAVAAPTGTSEDVETLAEALWDAMPAHHVGWRGLNGQSREFYRGNAERLLASDWLAAREAAARAEGAAKALTDLADDIDSTGYGWTSVVDAERFKSRLRERAARIAREQFPET